MDDQRADRAGGGIMRVCKAILSVVAVLGLLNFVAVMIHEFLLAGMTDECVNGRCFVWDKLNHRMYTEVSERSYRLLQIHEYSVPLGMVIAAIALGILARLDGDQKNKNPTT
jgi:hypothetical protein